MRHQNGTTKVCTKCLTAKPLFDFGKHKDGKFGLAWECKSCKSNYDRERRANEEFLHRERKSRHNWYYNKGGKKIVARNSAAYRKKYGQKRRSRLKERSQCAVAYAIKTGKLKRTACQECGNPKSEAHHTDYSKPLDVEFLCRRCHQLKHFPHLKELFR